MNKKRYHPRALPDGVKLGSDTDFELLWRNSEKEYDNLWNDFRVVVGWNTDIAGRYNFLTELLPTPSEIERLIHEYRQRYVTLEHMNTLSPSGHKIVDVTIQSTHDCIIRLEKLKHAAIQLQGSPIQTARETIKAQHRTAYDSIVVAEKQIEGAKWYTRLKKKISSRA